MWLYITAKGSYKKNFESYCLSLGLKEQKKNSKEDLELEANKAIENAKRIQERAMQARLNAAMEKRAHGRW